MKKSASGLAGLGWPVWAGIGGGGLVLIVVLIIIFSRGSGGGPVGPGGKNDPAARLPITPCPPRESKNLVASAPVPAPGSWKVTPTGTPLVSKLPSGFTCDIGQAVAVLFSSPDKAQAAVVGTRKDPITLHWQQYDLRKAPDPIASVELDRIDNSWIPHVSADLSPSGERLAVAVSKAVGVWARDGKRLGTLAPSDIYRPCPWVGFADETHVANLSLNGQLALWDVASEKTVTVANESYQAPAALSPGRQYLAARRGNGFDVLRSADLTPAGRLELPPDLEATNDRLDNRPRLAFNAEGTSLALSYPVKKGLYVFTWDMTTGRLKDGLYFEYGVATGNGALGIVWCAPRSLSFSGGAGGFVVDLDLGAVVWQCSGGAAVYAANAPDGRLWHVAVLRRNEAEPVWKQLKGSALPPPIEKDGDRTIINPFTSHPFLFAATFPPPTLAKQLERARGGLVITRQMTFRAEVQAEGDEYRTAAATKVADLLAAQGFRTDPQATQTLRLKFRPPILKEISSGGGVVRSITIKPGAKRPPPADEKAGKIAFAYAEAQMDLVDAKGKVLWTSNTIEANVQIGRANDPSVQTNFPAKAEEARQALLNNVLDKKFVNLFSGSGLIEDPLVIRDAQGVDLPLPMRQAILVMDGQPEPAIDPVAPKHKAP